MFVYILKVFENIIDDYFIYFCFLLNFVTLYSNIFKIDSYFTFITNNIYFKKN